MYAQTCIVLISINIKTKLQVCHVVALKIPHIKVYFTHYVCQLSVCFTYNVWKLSVYFTHNVCQLSVYFTHNVCKLSVYFTHNVCQLSSFIVQLYIMLYKTSTPMFISLNINVLCCAFKYLSCFVESNCRMKICILQLANGFYLHYIKAKYIYQFCNAFTHMYLGSTQSLT